MTTTTTTTAVDNGARPSAVALVVVAAVAVVVAPTWWGLAPTVLLVVAAAWLSSVEAHRSTIAATVCWAGVGLASVVSFGLVWPIPPLLGLAAAGIVLWRLGWGRPAWIGPGRPDRGAQLLAAASVPVTTITLVAFITSGRTDLDAATEGLQSLPTWTLPLAGVGFVLVNPTVEEILFRGLLQTMVADVSARPRLGIAAQAIAFGAIHVDGVPGGPLGVALAAGWGAVLGVVRHRTGSIRLVWIVHALANVAIYSTVVVLAVDDGIL